ncbi:hypothetical protein T484DRAFT_1834861 [Baffinella frigidus]|nr:hypothetical protein T484DRAFT_1834861 [Cryptophyta sp. CCMP2293]
MDARRLAGESGRDQHRQGTRGEPAPLSPLQEAMEDWLQSLDEDRFHMDQTNNRVVLPVCFLTLCDDAPNLAMLLMTRPEEFAQVASRAFLELCPEKTVRFWARPSIPPFQIGIALGHPNDIRATQLIHGQVLSLESPTLSLWSHTCVCADASCPGAESAFVLTALDGVELGSAPQARCPHCGSRALVEDFAARTFCPSSTILLSVRGGWGAVPGDVAAPREHGLCRIVAVLLQDDLSEMPITVGQTLEVLGYVARAGAGSMQRACSVFKASGASTNTPLFLALTVHHPTPAPPRGVEFPAPRAPLLEAFSQLDEAVASLAPAVPGFFTLKLAILLAHISTLGAHDACFAGARREVHLLVSVGAGGGV